MNTMKLTSLVALAALLCGCGGTEPKVEQPLERAPEAVADPSVTSAVLTTAVDGEGNSAAPASTKFPRDTERIHLVADFADLPVGAKIKVSWIQVKGGEPILRTDKTGFGDFHLVTSLPAPSGGFDKGDYQVLVYVNDARLEKIDFRIGDKANDWTGVRGLMVSSAITAWDHEPIGSKSSFPSGTKRVYATFQVRTSEPSPYVTVVWLKGEKELSANDLECAREVRCVDSHEKGKQLSPGDYAVEVEVNGEMMARRGFHVGGDSVSPMLQHTALGVAKGKKRMPKKHKAVFGTKLSGLRCGVKVSTLPDEAKFKVKWVAVTEDGDEERYTSEETVTGGGTKTAVLDWPIEGEVTPGRYKAVVKLGSRKLEEIEFTVE